jgi:hypothetical protein
MKQYGSPIFTSYQKLTPSLYVQTTEALDQLNNYRTDGILKIKCMIYNTAVDVD